MAAALLRDDRICILMPWYRTVKPSSEQARRIEQNGHRSVIGVSDLHDGLENAAARFDTRLPDAVQVILIESETFPGRSGPIPGRPASPPYVSIQGELRHDQDFAARFPDGAILPALLVLENAKVHDFFGKIFRVFFDVIDPHAKVYQQTFLDVRVRPIPEAERAIEYTLDHAAHFRGLFDGSKLHAI
jgi:hypothetical protein